MSNKVKSGLMLTLVVLMIIVFALPDFILIKFMPVLLIIKYAPGFILAAAATCIVVKMTKQKKE